MLPNNTNHRLNLGINEFCLRHNIILRQPEEYSVGKIMGLNYEHVANTI